MTDGGPAFPIYREFTGEHEFDQGMSLRDYFAAAALPPVLSALQLLDGSCDYVAAAVRAYHAADAMLAERAKAR